MATKPRWGGGAKGLSGRATIKNFFCGFPNQLNMVVFFSGIFEKNDLSNVHVYSSVHWTSHFSQATAKHGHV